MNANTKRGLMMTFSPTAIALIVVLISGYVIGVSLGTLAYKKKKKNY